MGGGTVRVLGDLSVDGLDVHAGLDRKARTLLRLLALARGRAVATEALVDAVWGDRPPAKPADQVAVLASRVRRLLGRDAITHGDGGYRLRGVPIDLDELDAVVTETETRLAQGGTTAVVTARIALALVRGPVGEDDTAADWVRADQSAATGLVQRARRAAAEAFLRAGAWPEALDLARADLLADPYDEIAARALMRAESAAGRPARALQVFADLRTVLADELGTDPHPDTDALHAAILRGETATTTRATPRPLLIGRTSQLDHLDSLAGRLGEGKVRVAQVTGEAGIGKTTLLRAWTRSRQEAGDLVLAGTCGSLDAAAPLDVVLAAIEDHLRHHPDVAAALGEEAAVLHGVLGGTPDGTAVDPVLGPATLYAALTRVLERVAGGRGAILVIDDAHLAGPALGDWLEFAQRRPIPLLVVAAVRRGEGARLPASDEIGLGPFGLAEATQLVGAERAADLLARSGGHPLFLSELAGAGSGELPASLVAAVRERCDQLGDAAELVRSAALLGKDVDVDLLAAVLGLPTMEVLRRVETAAERGLLVERDGRYGFRHDLVRGALAADAPEARVQVLHREAARALAARSGADPLAVAEHARRGGDDALAAGALVDAAGRAASRFDHLTTERLLAESLALVDDAAVRVARARALIRLGAYTDAESTARTVGTSESATTAAWAAYFDRRFDGAVAHADDAGTLAAGDADLARALMAGGRIHHARGDLTTAEDTLRRAVALAEGADRLTASAWLGVLLAHRSRPAEALDLLRPATQPGVGVDHTSAALHALLFTGHAHALAGRPAQALATFAQYTDEVEHRQVPRFAGRGVNFGGWVLRNVGANAAATDAHQEALDVADRIGTTELEIAVLEDLAEERITAGDPDAAADLLQRARTALAGDLVFGWRLGLKLSLHEARVALLREEYDVARELADALRVEADALGVPRYTSVAAVLGHQAAARSGEQVDPARVLADLDAVRDAVALEAWWWAGETAAALGERSLLNRVESLVAELAPACGEYAETLHADADRRIAAWSLSVR